MESAKLAQELRESRAALDRATHDARARSARLCPTIDPPCHVTPRVPLRSIAAESSRAVAAADGRVHALELEAAEAKRDAGEWLKG